MMITRPLALKAGEIAFCALRLFARETASVANSEIIESYVPARLDRLPWSSWHWLIVVSLGATWILDGLEVTLAGALGGVLTRHETLGLSDAQVGASATCYLAGAVIGALLLAMEPIALAARNCSSSPLRFI
jgi:hypothetical protein